LNETLIVDQRKGKTKIRKKNKSYIGRTLCKWKVA